MASAVQHFLSWVGDLICQNGMPEMQKNVGLNVCLNVGLMSVYIEIMSIK